MKTACLHNYAAHLFQQPLREIVPLSETPFFAAGCIDAPVVMPAGSIEHFDGEYYVGALQTTTYRN